MKANVAVAISGGGRSLENLCLRSNDFGYQIKAVISSSHTCGGLQVAETFNLPVLIADFVKNQLVADDVARFLAENEIDWIVLAGFLKPFPILSQYNKKVINIHPSLLPKYGGKGMYGMHVHRRVLSEGDSESGATIHFVSEKYDEGDIIAQKKISIEGLKHAEEIASKVLELECELQPSTLHELVTKD